MENLTTQFEDKSIEKYLNKSAKRKRNHTKTAILVTGRGPINPQIKNVLEMPWQILKTSLERIKGILSNSMTSHNKAQIFKETKRMQRHKTHRTWIVLRFSCCI